MTRALIADDERLMREQLRARRTGGPLAGAVAESVQVTVSDRDGPGRRDDDHDASVAEPAARAASRARSSAAMFPS